MVLFKFFKAAYKYASDIWIICILVSQIIIDFIVDLKAGALEMEISCF